MPITRTNRHIAVDIPANFRERNIGKDLAIPCEMMYNIQAGLPPIAQLDRVPDSDSVGRGFESPWAGQNALAFNKQVLSFSQPASYFRHKMRLRVDIL